MTGTLEKIVECQHEIESGCRDEVRFEQARLIVVALAEGSKAYEIAKAIGTSDRHVTYMVSALKISEANHGSLKRSFDWYYQEAKHKPTSKRGLARWNKIERDAIPEVFDLVRTGKLALMPAEGLVKETKHTQKQVVSTVPVCDIPGMYRDPRDIGPDRRREHGSKDDPSRCELKGRYDLFPGTLDYLREAWEGMTKVRTLKENPDYRAQLRAELDVMAAWLDNIDISEMEYDPQSEN